MYYEFFVSYLTLVINFLEDRSSEEQILRDLTLAIQRAISKRSAKRAARPRDSIKVISGEEYTKELKIKCNLS